MKKIVCLMLAFILCLGLAACGGQTTPVDGTDANIEAPVSGKANEDYFEWDGNIITALSDSGAKQKSLVIPARCEGFNGCIFAGKENNVTSVSFESDKDIELNEVFLSAEKLTTISLPASLSKIGDMEFNLCSALQEITIPASVESIGAYAFQYDSSLTTVRFEGNVTEIMRHAFEKCTSLETVVFPDTVTLIDEYAFYQCTALKTITLPAGLKNIGAFAFSNSGLTTVIVPESLELDAWDTTAFVQADHDVTVQVVEGSWADENFDSVFDGAFVKVISE